MRLIETILSDAVLTAAAGALVILAIMVLAIVAEELRIRKQIGAWMARKEQPKPIIDVWGNHQAHIQVSARFYLDNLLPN